MNISTKPGDRYTGDPFGGIIVAKINDELLIADSNDLSVNLNWNECTRALKDTAWRLPTLIELNFMREDHDLLRMNSKIYWSCESYKSTSAWHINVSGVDAGFQENSGKEITYYRARPVRLVPAPRNVPLSQTPQTDASTAHTTSIEPSVFAAYRQGFQDGYHEGAHHD